MKRVGHQGADALAPGNTEASFRAAAEAGVDMVEFDVLAEHPDGTGELLLAHDRGDLARRRDSALTLDAALDVLEELDVELGVDLKWVGYELRVVEALRARGLLARALFSTMETPSLGVLRARAPEVRLGWSVPRLKRNPFASPLTAGPAYLALQVMRRALPRRAARAITSGRCDAVMANHHLVTARLAAAVADAGGELYVWTVDDADRIAWLAGLGVAGVTTNDPRLFGAAQPPVSAQVAAE